MTFEDILDAVNYCKAMGWTAYQITWNREQHNYSVKELEEA